MVDLKQWLMFRPWRRHGLVLTVGGLVYILMGISFLTLGNLSRKDELSVEVALQIMSVKAWAIVFITAGFLSCLSSRWPVTSDNWGYMLLCGLSSAWSAIYFLGYFIGNGTILNINSGFIWFLASFIWWAISGLVNPQNVVVVEVHNGAD